MVAELEELSLSHMAPEVSICTHAHALDSGLSFQDHPTLPK